LDFQALIEFNKYMLALSAGCFVYALDKFVPMPTSGGRYLLLTLLGAFFLSTVIGVVIFAAATSALHPKKKPSIAKLERVIGPLGMVHTSLLIIGLLILGWMLSGRVMAAP